MPFGTVSLPTRSHYGHEEGKHLKLFPGELPILIHYWWLKIQNESHTQKNCSCGLTNTNPTPLPLKSEDPSTYNP